MRNDAIPILACFLILLICSPIVFVHYHIIGVGLPTRNIEMTMDMNLSEASLASFIGEAAYDWSGWSVSGAGDVNGDGYDDALIGASENSDGGALAGKTYILFGKPSGWLKNISLANADASFIGEVAEDESGWSISGAGDVNGDGYDDILIGSSENSEGGFYAGQVYLFLGKPIGWTRNVSLSKADASFLGEDSGPTGDRVGRSVSGAGDVNGDGYDDILMASANNCENGMNAGQTYLIFGKPSGWKMDVSLANVDASFIGEAAGDYSGTSVSAAGDVNGDGYDDILIGADSNDEGGRGAGQTYLILGKASGWAMDTSLSTASASFWGEASSDYSGWAVSGAGDVNGDGYDDILIGANSNSEGGLGAGQTYIILGKPSGWTMDVSLSNADASFLGEAAEDGSGVSVSGAGDINGDGFDDLLIGAFWNDEGGSEAGQAYLIHGKPSGWAMDVSLSNTDASFIGEGSGDEAGWSVSGAGDVNGDGCDDLIIGARFNTQGGTESGKTYLLSIESYSEPLEIYDIAVTDKEGGVCKRADIGDLLKVEVTGLDGNASRMDRSRVNVTFSKSLPARVTIFLVETGKNTGTYKGVFVIPARAKYLENITFSAYIDPTKNATVQVHTPIQIRPLNTSIGIVEDSEMDITFRNFGYNDVTNWIFETNAQWLQWDPVSHTITGIPDNSHVGTWWTHINITDGMGNSDDRNYTLTVMNAPPIILNENNGTAYEDVPYFVDYDCDDEGQRNTRWSMQPYVGWLSIYPETGVLQGTPAQGDIGSIDLNISVNDGNGGREWTTFTLTVMDINDPPRITTEPPTSVLQGKNYYVQFNALDEDDMNTFEWTMGTDAGFLLINNQTGVLSGTPENEDVGIYFINITAKDLRGLTDWLNYSLEVIDVNDIPIWTSVPIDPEIGEGEMFEFNVDATDIDPGDDVVYGIETSPDIGMTIDERTGMIHWMASLEGLKPNPNYVVQVTLSASDGELAATDYFTLKVVPNPFPVSNLLSPSDEELVPSTGALLKWEFEDDSDEVMFDIHLSEYYSFLFSPDRSTLVAEDLNATSLFVDELSPGKSYFWTVIPKDRFSVGTCSNPIWKFRVNEHPLIDPISTQTATVGKEWRLHMQGSDLETAVGLLEFSYVSGPQGMEFDEGNDDLEWMPGADQVGDHIVIISLYDGLESSNSSFTITVKELEERPDEPDDNRFVSILIIVIAIIILLIIIGSVVFFVLRRKKGTNEKGTTSPVDESPIAPEAPKEQSPPVAGSPQETIPPLSPDNTIVEETHIEGKEVSSPIQNN